MENIEIYKALMNTPPEAKKEIAAGRLKGFTDINPMYRIRKLTEVFGPCGVGWNTVNVKYTIQEMGQEKAIFCELGLVYKHGDQWSDPVYGCGGNKLVTIERNGPYLNDEAYKMAYTDALSIACKSLGMCHDVYFAKDRTKYDLPESEPEKAPQKAEQPKTLTQKVEQAKATIQKTDTVPPVEEDPKVKAKAMMDGIIKKLGITTEQFVAFRTQLIRDGVIAPKGFLDMTQSDWDSVGNAIIEVMG